MAKNVTIGNILKAINLNDKDDTQVVSFGDNDNKVEVTVKKRISLADKIEFINIVASSVFDINEDENKVIYKPYYKKFMFDCTLVLYFTDITLPNNEEKITTFLRQTQIVPKITEIVGDEYIKDIMYSIDELIDFKKREAANSTKAADIMSGIEELINVFKEKIEGMNAEDLMKLLNASTSSLPYSFNAINLNAGDSNA